MCIPIVDSNIEHQLVEHGSGSSSSSSSASSSSDSSSEGPSRTDLDSGGQEAFSGSTVSATNYDSSSLSRSNKYRRVAVQIGRDVVDVDAMCSDACPVHMLSKGEYSAHTSSYVKALFLPYFC